MTDAPKNLAQLKRFIQPGMKLERNAPSWTKGGPPEIGTYQVRRTQGNAFTLMMEKGESWHNYEKASAYTFQPNGFTVTIKFSPGSDPAERVIVYRYAQ